MLTVSHKLSRFLLRTLTQERAHDSLNWRIDLCLYVNTGLKTFLTLDVQGSSSTLAYLPDSADHSSINHSLLLISHLVTWINWYGSNRSSGITSQLQTHKLQRFFSNPAAVWTAEVCRALHCWKLIQLRLLIKKLILWPVKLRIKLRFCG